MPGTGDLQRTFIKYKALLRRPDRIRPERLDQGVGRRSSGARNNTSRGPRLNRARQSEAKTISTETLLVSFTHSKFVNLVAAGRDPCEDRALRPRFLLHRRGGGSVSSR